MTQCLTCPEPENYAAVALQLQNTALQAEACLFELDRQLQMATNPPTIVMTSAGQIITANTLTDLTAGALAFSNVPPATSAFITVPALTSIATILPPGVYQAGACINATATGAINDNSLRVLRVRTKKMGTPTDATPDFSTEITVYEPNNGNGSDMSIAATVTLDGTQDILFSFVHTNVASTISIASGAIFWVSRLSNQVALRTV